jgi:hypothetical protein
VLNWNDLWLIIIVSVWKDLSYQNDVRTPNL